MTESYYVHVNLNKDLSIECIQAVLFDAIHLPTVKSSEFNWIHKEALSSPNKNIKPHFSSYYNQINFDYAWNEYGIPASIFAEFYSNSLNNKSSQFYISGFNKPGADFINTNYRSISINLFNTFTKKDLSPKIIHTFDSAYQTPELFRIHRYIESKTGIRDIIT